MAAQNQFESLNEDVAGWAKLQRQKMLQKVAALTLKDKHAIRKRIWAISRDASYKTLSRSLGFSLKKEFGSVSRVNFRLVKHGIFFDRSVGKKRTVGSTPPKNFIAPVLDPALESLAEILANKYADLAVGEIKINIPGIISKRVQVNNG